MIKWLLRNNPALLGDLTEERANGRPRAWLYWQVTVGVARSIFDEVRDHPVLTLRGAATGVGISLAAAAIAIFTQGILFYFFPALAGSSSSRWLLVPFELLPCALGGWAMARTHRTCLEASIVVAILVAIFIDLPVDASAFTDIAGFLAGAMLGVKQYKPPELA